MRFASDIAFLLARADCAGTCSFARGRWTGSSSNALVAFAFGVTRKEYALPSDWSDYAACVLTFLRLPKHRATTEVRALLARGKSHVESKYPAKERRAYSHEYYRKQRRDP